jgi:hypothetical protein
VDSYDGPPSSSTRRTDTWRRRTATTFAIPCARTIHGISLSHRLRCIAAWAARATAAAAAAEWWSFTASSCPRRDESQYVSRASAGDVSEQSCHGSPAPASHARAAFLPWFNACRSRRAHAVVASDTGTTSWVHAYNPRALHAAPVVVTVARPPSRISVKIAVNVFFFFSKNCLRNAKSSPNIFFFFPFFFCHRVVTSHCILSFRHNSSHCSRTHTFYCEIYPRQLLGIKDLRSELCSAFRSFIQAIERKDFETRLTNHPEKILVRKIDSLGTTGK